MAGRMVEFSANGANTPAYLATPPSGTGPGVIVIQEWWGLNDQIRGVAEKLADAGYRALVPDLYRGKTALEANEAEHLMNNLDFGDAAGQDVRGAAAHLKATGSKKVGVTGFCMGGALTLLASLARPATRSSVVGALLILAGAAGVAEPFDPQVDFGVQEQVHHRAPRLGLVDDRG